MNILLCHERFLFRFGADRTLILLGKSLKRFGHNVTVLANRYDAKIVRSFASRVVDCPADNTPYIDLNEFTSDWLRSSWRDFFDDKNAPDVVIVGGWPFFSAIPFFREVCDHVIFIDFGAVPIYGYPEPTRAVLQKLRLLRTQHLPSASLVLSISRFIAESQSRPDSRNGVPVRTILLGADHLDIAMWPADELKLDSPSGAAVEIVRSLRRHGKRILLCLGRWEPGCYKNSEAALELMQAVTAQCPDAVLIVLEHPSRLEVPAHLTNAVVPIGFPDDQELIEIIKQAELGISFSLWEGFNLPLAEMEWFARPALAFNVGAHPEVIAHPWYLCQDASEMANKAVELLSGGGPSARERTDSLKTFRTYFTWDRFLNEYSELLQELTRPPQQGRILRKSALIIDVTNSTKDAANSGVVRVARRLSRALQDFGAHPIFVIWEEIAGSYVLPTRAEYEVLGQFNGPSIHSTVQLSSAPERRMLLDDILADQGGDCWLLIPELKVENSFARIRRFARDRNLKIATIFYDAIPVLRPELCNGEIRENHGQYMLGIAECDLAIAISKYSAKCLKDFWRDRRIVSSCMLSADALPGEFGGTSRSGMVRRSSDKVDILCVSTLEPRKNHCTLIQACLWMAEKHPELNWSLTLVGNRYAGAFQIADWIQSVSAKDTRIKWLGIVDDATLDRLYERCSFTVYPSIIEGFGLPILESMWHGRPCICSDGGVMAELAEGGGCQTTDITQPGKLADAIYELATNQHLWLRLAGEAVGRPLKTWSEYANELLDAMAKCSPRSPDGVYGSTAPTRDSTSPVWQNALYPGCLCNKWQMNDSERMALTGLLARHTPHCSIEVGTYWGGSLSLISQYSKMVFSIDIDDNVRSRLSFSNVTFLTGRSTVILPHLLSELDKADIAVEFILVDGDHSTVGVKEDIECLLSYIPRRPLFVVMHDSFNPGCRKGMLEASWNRSPYCHWVDIDFVPGRVVETPDAFCGELWGGLGAAYFLPFARSGELQVRKTSEQMFQTLAAGRAATMAAGS